MQPFSTREILDSLQYYDLLRFAQKLGYSKNDLDEINDDLAAQLLSLALTLSRGVSDSERLGCLAICGLLWEYRKDKWSALEPALTIALARIGLGPSSRTLPSNHAQISSTGSLFADLALTASLAAHEVEVNGVKFTLSKDQHQIWSGLQKYSKFGVSAPTSAGKSFIMALHVGNVAARSGGKILYVVPTLTLISQVSQDVRAILNRLGILDYLVLNTIPHSSGPSEKEIYIVTQERASFLINRTAETIGKLSLVIIDEVQNLEKMTDGDEDRPHILYDVITSILQSSVSKQISICGPRISNLNELTKRLLGDDAESISLDIPPVLNVTYSFAKSDNIWKLRSRWNVTDEILEVDLPNRPSILPGPGTKRYTKKYLNFVAHLCTQVRDDGGVVVFAPTTSTAHTISMSLQRNSERGQSERDSLSDYILSSTHPAYDLPKCVRRDVGYHHGQIPPHIRAAIELAYKAKTLSAIVSTTTLLQGVNLPAKYIIARSPKLFTRDDEEVQITPYEFSNLRGRAGRLLQEFLGRAIVLDEANFTGEVEYLDTDALREVKSGYQLTFEEYRDSIVEACEQGQIVQNVADHQRVIVYIRQVLLRWGDQAMRKLHAVGINIDESALVKIASSLKGTEEIKDVCLECSTIDPLLVRDLHIRMQSENWPTFPSTGFDQEFLPKMIRLLELLQLALPIQYFELMDPLYDNERLSKLSRNWLLEVKLSRLLWGSRNDEEVNTKLKRIYKLTAHNLPKLIRPAVLLQNRKSPLLSALEHGSSTNLRTLIEAGIPRELAIALRKAGLLISDDDTIQVLMPRVKEFISKLVPWEQRILHFYLS